MPLVTVLMPVYNAERFVRDAIDSILRQTLQDFELLIINDASTDNSLSIISSYRDARIRIINNATNAGISASLNKGIHHSSTELIARMDADDISHPSRLQKQYEFFQNNPGCALLSSWVNVITEDGKFIRSEEFRSKYYYYNMTFDCWMYHPSVMYKKSTVLDAGGYNSMYSEDYDLFWHIMRKYKIDNLEEALLDYRVTSQSLHQVTKKAEYDHALNQQTIRNFKFYAGESFDVSTEELQCLQFNVDPILKLQRIGALVTVFKKLDVITRGILNCPNPNLNEKDVREAWYFRRRFMRKRLMSRLGLFKKAVLRLRLAASTLRL